MKDARQVNITGARLDPDTGMMRLAFTEPFGPAFKREVSTKDRISSDLFLPDPYEHKTVEVRDSSIPEAGQGVFLKRSVPNATVVSYFNGIRIKEGDIWAVSGGKKSPYLVEIGEEDDFLDIPPNLQSWDNYQSSTGHKVNHAKKANAIYAECDHPRFGPIHCLLTLEVCNAQDVQLLCKKFNLPSPFLPGPSFSPSTGSPSTRAA